MFQSLTGLFAFIGIAWLMSENRRAVPVKTVIVGLFLQIIIGVVLLKVPISRELFLWLNRMVLFIQEAARAGTSMTFGYLGGAALPFEATGSGSSFVLAFQSLPIILVMSAISALGFYWKIIPVVVKGFSVALQRTLHLGGAEGVGVSANVFVGMIEAPLFIRPYLSRMTRSEIFTLMTCGMATIAGTVMVLYADILSGAVPDVLGHILTASIISVPAAILISKTMIPETGELTAGDIDFPEPMLSVMDAITKGTIQGVQLLINIVAMLIVLVALVHLVNLFLGLFPSVNGSPVTLQGVLGVFMAPVVWLMGIPWSEAVTAGGLMGTKTILNEFIAYLDLSAMSPETLSDRSRLIMTYALCGFANPGSLGIMIGGMGTMAPDRRDEIVSLGFRSIVAGTLATSMTGAVVGILLI